jgi:hypothetical protein
MPQPNDQRCCGHAAGAGSLGPGSILLLSGTLGFWLLNHVDFLVSEEPGWRRRFGEPYR